ncbi:MAG: transporter [Sterolibacteriaceae bacterium MAG5]|nr:transporter [Candidatus Nitricoxidireducens bremensis]
MKKFVLTLCAAFIGFAMPVFDAEAKRLGGGMSSGMKRDSGVMQRQAAPAAPTSPAAAPAKPATPQAAPQPSGMSRWLGPLAGIAAGIGLAALLSHFGLGEGFASILMMVLLAGAIFFVVRLLLRKREPENRMAYAGPAPAHFEPASMPAGGAAAPAASGGNIPADFDVAGFVRNAKANFIRLQAANDAGNLDDIRAFTSPEMFAEIKLQYEERGRAKQETDVMQLDAEVLDVATEDRRYVVSVRFHGLIREEAGAAPENFDEVWHLTKPMDGASGWVVAGIQQYE